MGNNSEAPKFDKLNKARADEVETLKFLLYGPSGDSNNDSRIAAAILKTEQKRAPNYEPVFETGIHAQGLNRVDVFSGKPLKSYS